MKKLLIAICALAALASCRSLKEEWQPVFEFGDSEGAFYVPVSDEWLMANKGMETITSIADLKAMWEGGSMLIPADNIWIKGQIVSSDLSGNISRELYLQDKTGAIDLKVGKYNLYNEYQRGQWIYVKCDGLTMGAYSGMLQLGLALDNTGNSDDYGTSYIEPQALIDEHVFRGFVETPVKPTVVTEKNITDALAEGSLSSIWGKLVTVKGVVYGNEIFALFYPVPDQPHKSGNPENRVFLSDAGNWGIYTWACTKQGYIDYLRSGVWDTAMVGSGSTKYGTILGSPAQYLSGDSEKLARFGADANLPYKEIMIKYAANNYVSHYFNLGDAQVSVRTSGYAKFADVAIEDEVLNGTPVNITGIATFYSSGSVPFQISLVDDPSVSVQIAD